jgi:threonine dehydratase
MSPGTVNSIEATTAEDPALSQEITVEDVLAAQRRIAPHVRRTPLVPSKTLSKRFRSNMYLKLELFQRTGAFKVRGAFNKILGLLDKEKPRGVVAVSGGNHGQAVAYAARKMGLKALILMPAMTPSNYIEATQGYGAKVVTAGSMKEAFERATKYEREGWSFIHPFDDPLVIAGQGTLGLEILEAVPRLTDVILSVGGGGLAAGVGVAVRSQNPGVRIWGVETEGADSMAQALKAGRVVDLEKITSIARTLGAPAVSTRTLALAREHLKSVTVVPDREAVRALSYLLERMKVLTEPASSCTLAAAERLREHFSPRHHVVLVLCGGNVALSDLLEYERRFGKSGS